MKKTYIKPIIETIHVGMQQPVAASGISFSDDGLSGSGSLNDEDAFEALSRGLGIW